MIKKREKREIYTYVYHCLFITFCIEILYTYLNLDKLTLNEKRYSRTSERWMLYRLKF